MAQRCQPFTGVEHEIEHVAISESEYFPFCLLGQRGEAEERNPVGFSCL